LRAAAILDAGLHRRAERYVPRPYALAPLARVIAPSLLRRLQSGRAGALMTTHTDPGGTAAPDAR
jgi:uncharacterized protein